MNRINLNVFNEDLALQSEGCPIYPLQGEELYFCTPRVGGFKYQKQIQDIIKAQYGLYRNDDDVDMSLVQAIWLGEYITDFGGALEVYVSEKTKIKISQIELINNEIKEQNKRKASKSKDNKIKSLENKLSKAEIDLQKSKDSDSEVSKELPFTRENCRAIFANKGMHLSLVPLLISKASNFEYYLTAEGREAIEELKKR